jgi:hypothetical protein
MKPQIVDDLSEDKGVNNNNLDKAIERIDKSKMYEDLSTIIICPTRGMFPTRIVQSWMKLQRPMNQLVAGPIFAESMKVDAAYNGLIEYILKSDYLNKFKYILTIEEDNMPPSDGLLRLYENMDKYDVVGGLYWGKGKEGFPMIFGNPEDGPMDVKPQKPIAGELQECNAMGMGFNLFKLDMFREMEGPWFKTLEGSDEYGIDQKVTQDIYFYRKASEKGYKFACDNRVLVGHYDHKNDKVW